MQPHSDSPDKAPSAVTMCPTCLKPMRIHMIDARGGREYIRFVCATCRTEETHENDIDALI